MFSYGIFQTWRSKVHSITASYNHHPGSTTINIFPSFLVILTFICYTTEYVFLAVFFKKILFIYYCKLSHFYIMLLFQKCFSLWDCQV